jgi:DNA invertase Pin-like site-specific DNA recombinase
MLVYMTSKFVTYHRVSTTRQGQSGLGLEAQRESVSNFLKQSDWEIVGQFTEVESGKRKSRPELTRALAMCKKQGATLVIAKLDRLARNLHFITGLMESGVNFVAADNPAATRLTVQILAAVAEEEGRSISERTKNALAQAKARGTKLGTNGKVLAAKNREEAEKRAQGLAQVVSDIKASGHTSIRAIAAELNRQDVPTAKGGKWHIASVQRLLKRISV